MRIKCAGDVNCARAIATILSRCRSIVSLCVCVNSGTGAFLHFSEPDKLQPPVQGVQHCHLSALAMLDKERTVVN